MEVIKQWNGLFSAANDELRFSYYCCLFSTRNARRALVRSLVLFSGVSWGGLILSRRTCGFLQRSLVDLYAMRRPIRVGPTMRRTLVAGAVRQYKPVLEEMDLLDRQSVLRRTRAQR